MITYSAPHYSSFGMRRHFDYTEAGFRDCLFADQPIQLAASPTWSDDLWFVDQDDRHLEASSGWWVLQEGAAEETILGGNLCTFNLVQETVFMPSLADSVLFLEDDDRVKPWDFDRDLMSVLQQPGFGGVQAVVIGRFQRESAMSRELLEQIVVFQARACRPPGDCERGLRPHHSDIHLPDRRHRRGRGPSSRPEPHDREALMTTPRTDPSGVAPSLRARRARLHVRS
jgi:muramoyltetrapeptide carboxypeptidase LdcA involved in peptidoglycan recycling